MGKKSKKSLYKQIKPFVKNHKVLLAALGGAATGITFAKILGTEKAQQVLQTVEDSISNVADKMTNGLRGVRNESPELSSRNRELAHS